MQEQRSKEAKNAEVKPLMSHIATPSSFVVHPWEPWSDEDRTLGPMEFPLELKLQKVVEVVAAMNWRWRSKWVLISVVREEDPCGGWFMVFDSFKKSKSICVNDD